MLRASVSGRADLLRVAARATERLLLALEHAPPARHTERPEGGLEISTQAQAECLGASLTLLATVWGDASDAFSARGGGSGSSGGPSRGAPSFADCLPHLATTLAALHRLLGHVVAAGSAAAGRPATAMAAVARWYWHAPEWQEHASLLAETLLDISVSALDDLQPASPEHAAAAASCAAAALRLAPLLPQLPLHGGGGAGAVAVVPAGTCWVSMSEDMEELLEANPAQALAVAAQQLAGCLMQSLADGLLEGPAAARLATPSVARAAFEAASLACSYEWAAASSDAAEAEGACSAGAAAGSRQPGGAAGFKAVDEALHAACLAAVAAHVQLLDSGGGGEDVQRCAAAAHWVAYVVQTQAVATDAAAPALPAVTNLPLPRAPARRPGGWTAWRPCT